MCVCLWPPESHIRCCEFFIQSQSQSPAHRRWREKEEKQDTTQDDATGAHDGGLHRQNTIILSAANIALLWKRLCETMRQIWFIVCERPSNSHPRYVCWRVYVYICVQGEYVFVCVCALCACLYTGDPLRWNDMIYDEARRRACARQTVHNALAHNALTKTHNGLLSTNPHMRCIGEKIIHKRTKKREIDESRKIYRENHAVQRALHLCHTALIRCWHLWICCFVGFCVGASGGDVFFSPESLTWVVVGMCFKNEETGAYSPLWWRLTCDHCARFMLPFWYMKYWKFSFEYCAVIQENKKIKSIQFSKTYNYYVLFNCLRYCLELIKFDLSNQCRNA